MERGLALLLVCLLLPTPARAGHDAASFAQPRGGAEVLVYLQPLPPELERVGFSLESASAVSEAGSVITLELWLPEVKYGEARRQRLVASGRLPAGGYAGLSIKLRKASLRLETGDSALAVPDIALRADVAFTASDDKGLVLWLSLGGPAPTAAAGTFGPELSASVAPRALAARSGFVSNAQSDSIIVFDRRLRQAVAVVPTCGGPSGMALDQRSGRLYVACRDDDEILAIDVASAEIVERARLAPGDGPREIALTPDGRTLLSVNGSSNSVGVFDTRPLTRLDRVSVGSGPTSVAIDPTGARAYVFNSITSSISVLDIARRNVVASVSTDAAPLRGQFNARGDRLFVIHERSPYVTVVDPQQLTVVTRARLRIGVGAVKVDIRRGLLYIGGRDDPLVELYDPSTLLPIGSMKTRAGVTYLTIDGEENHLYMVSPDTRTLAIASLAERKVVSEIDVGKGPCWVAAMGER